MATTTRHLRHLYFAALTGAIAATALAPLNSMADPAPVVAVPGNPPAPAERVAAVKRSFAESQALLRKYEWIETTTVSLKGDEKSRVQKRCYYGVDGKIEKVPVGGEPDQKSGRGLRGKIKEKKKEELSDYMEDVVALVHQYLPPDPVKIQAAKDAGKASILILEPGKRAKLEFRDYLQPQDLLSVEIDLVTNRILGAGVRTALGENKDPVTLDVRFDGFPDATIYTARTTLEAKAKKVTAVIENSGYRKVAP
jgi:hypothetical protein